MRTKFKEVTLTKLSNQLKGTNQLISTQFRYDRLDDVFEVVLYDVATVSKSTLDVPLRIYPTERQRASVGLIEDIMHTEEIAYVNKPLVDDDYTDVLISLEKPVVKYRELDTPTSKLHQIEVTKIIGDKEDVTITLVFTFSEEHVLNAQSLFAKSKEPLVGSELGQYLYDTFMGMYDRTPKLISVKSSYTETRLYPDNRLSSLMLVNNTLAIVGAGEASVGIDLEDAVGEVSITATGYIITIEYPNETEVIIYV